MKRNEDGINRISPFFFAALYEFAAMNSLPLAAPHG